MDGGHSIDGRIDTRSNRIAKAFGAVLKVLWFIIHLLLTVVGCRNNLSKDSGPVPVRSNYTELSHRLNHVINYGRARTAQL